MTKMRSGIEQDEKLAARVKIISLMCLACFVSMLFGMSLMAASEDAFAASSAEQKGIEYAQQDPGYEAAQQGSGSTQYFLDIEEPEPEKAPIDTTGTDLPKTGDSAESRLVLMIFGGLGVLAIAGLCVALWPRRLEDEEEPEDDDPFDDPLGNDDF